MKIHYLYKITNLINQKVYIGQTINPRARWYEHKKEATRDIPRMVIARAIKKYDSSSFIFELIACCLSQEDANFTETELVSQYNSATDKGYNISLGGMNAPKTDEWKKKISEALMGHEVSQETRDKVSVGNKGKIRSEEFKKNVGDFWRDKDRTEEHKNNLSEALKGNKNFEGHIHSEESKKKIGKANKGRAPAIKGKNTINKGKTWKTIDGKRVWMNKI